MSIKQLAGTIFGNSINLLLIFVFMELIFGFIVFNEYEEFIAENWSKITVASIGVASAVVPFLMVALIEFIIISVGKDKHKL